jgi:hypothetical protein
MLTSGALPDVDLGSLINSTIMLENQLNPYTDTQVYDNAFRDQISGFAEDFSFMNQLEAGLGEYAWGCLPISEDFPNQVPLQ